MATSSVSQVGGNQINRLCLENPEQIAKMARRKSIMMDVASKVIAALAVAFMVGVLAVSFGAGAGIAWLPYLTFGGMLATIPLGICFSKLEARRSELKAARSFAERIAQKYTQLSQMPEAEFGRLLREAGVQAPTVHKTVFARYLVYREIQEESYKQIKANFEFRDVNAQAVLIARREGYRRIEQEMIPAALNAAHMLQIIQNPYLQAASLSDIGIIQAKDFDQRWFDLLLDRTDAYFHFLQPGRAPLQLASIDQNPLLPKLVHPELIRAQLFPARGVA